jgi:hypothetical protein
MPSCLAPSCMRLGRRAKVRSRRARVCSSLSLCVRFCARVCLGGLLRVGACMGTCACTRARAACVCFVRVTVGSGISVRACARACVRVCVRACVALLVRSCEVCALQRRPACCSTTRRCNTATAPYAGDPESCDQARCAARKGGAARRRARTACTLASARRACALANTLERACALA